MKFKTHTVSILLVLYISLCMLAVSTVRAGEFTDKERNLKCYVYANMAGMDAGIQKLLLKSAAKPDSLRNAYIIGIAEGKVLGTAVTIPANNLGEAILFSASEWYKVEGCYVQESI